MVILAMEILNHVTKDDIGLAYENTAITAITGITVDIDRLKKKIYF